VLADEPVVSTSDTTEVHGANTFDIGALEDYLLRQVPEIGEELGGLGAQRGRRLDVRQFRLGQSNPTYLITAGSSRFVLRKKPPGNLLPSAHAVDREFRVISALQATNVPVPRAIAFCDDVNVIGTPFYLMAHVEGRVFWHHDLPGLSPGDRAAVYDELNRVLAELHKLDPEAIGLGDFGRPGNYCARQIARWTKQYRASEGERIEAMEQLIEWLPEHVPADEPHGLTHGDYRLDNVIFACDALRIDAVVDWELATLGNPLADFAYGCIGWRLPERLAGRDLAELGIPSESAYVDSYCRRIGVDSIPDLNFYIVFGMFRLAAILAGIAARVWVGNVLSAYAEETGRRTRPMAEAAWQQVVDGG
jgi:aminoglycoside phosphotransferase (APT) family kinase protein